MSNAEEKLRKKLIARYKSGKATENEIRALFTLLSTGELDSLIGEDMDREARLARRGHRFPGEMKIHRLIRYAAAASVLLLLGTGFYFLGYRHPKRTVVLTKQDVAPGGNKAVLTLANGRKIDLDDASVGELAAENGVRVRKGSDGQLIYDISGNRHAAGNEYAGTGRKNRDSMRPPAVAFNTISTPRGGQWQVILPDGSHVWLNAASTLRYPVVFSGKAREVEMQGEAYFEIAKLYGGGTGDASAEGRKRLPFLVRSGSQVVEVLGTHFNINAYPEEQAIRTTLLEGAVRLRTADASSSVLLKPGEQGTLVNHTIKVEAVNAYQAVAWKNGDFIFENQDLKTTMRQIARWYDVDVDYSRAPENLKIGGDVSRSNRLSAVLKAIELTGRVKFRVEGRKVWVEGM